MHEPRVISIYLWNTAIAITGDIKENIRQQQNRIDHLDNLVTISNFMGECLLFCQYEN